MATNSYPQEIEKKVLKFFLLTTISFVGFCHSLTVIAEAHIMLFSKGFETYKLNTHQDFPRIVHI